MKGWGYEDWELTARLVNTGVVKKRIKFGGIQFHQHHEIKERTGVNKNEVLYKKAIEDALVFCEQGLVQRKLDTESK